MSEKVQFEKLEEAEEYIRDLEEEIDGLKVQLRLLSQPAQYHSPQVGDGPIVSTMGFNTVLGRGQLGSLEGRLVAGWYKGPPLYQCTVNSAAPSTEQPSEISLEKPVSLQSSKQLSVNLRVEYYLKFCVDGLGLAVQEVNGFFLPLYLPPRFIQSYDLPFWETAPASEGAAKKPAALTKSCWNCGSPEHDLRGCPKPKDYARINSKRASMGGNHGTSRYHKPLDSRFSNKPGSPSAKLLAALGLEKGKVPEYVYRMKELGYPPGYKLIGRNSGISVYRGDRDSKDERKDSKIDSEVLYPGFNCPLHRQAVPKSWTDMDISDGDLEDGEVADTPVAGPAHLTTPTSSSSSSEDDCVPPPKVFAMDFPPDILQQMEATDANRPKRWKIIRGILRKKKRESSQQNSLPQTPS